MTDCQKKKRTARTAAVFILCAVCLFVFTVPTKAEGSGQKPLPKHLRILAIGNSLTQNSVYYVYDMAKELGIEDVTVGNMFIGGCSLKKHWRNARYERKAYLYYRKEGSTWKVRDDTSISEALADRQWDYVIFSPYSGDSGKAYRYNSLNPLADYVRDRVGKKTVFVWNMTWAYKQGNEARSFAAYDYDQENMYESIVHATKAKILKNERISMIIPSGTTIQNARTSSFGDNFTRDGRHLTPRGRYMVGLTWLSQILDLSPEQITYCPDEISPKMRKVAVASAKKALSDPFKISKINY